MLTPVDPCIDPDWLINWLAPPTHVATFSTHASTQVIPAVTIHFFLDLDWVKCFWFSLFDFVRHTARPWLIHLSILVESLYDPDGFIYLSWSINLSILLNSCIDSDWPMYRSRSPQTSTVVDSIVDQFMPLHTIYFNVWLLMNKKISWLFHLSILVGSLIYCGRLLHRSVRPMFTAWSTHVST